MEQTAGQGPLDKTSGSDRGPGSERPRRPNTATWIAALVLPILVFIFTQLDFVQRAEGWFIRGLVWDIGRKEIVADLFAPIWVVSIIVLAVLGRRLVARYRDTEPAASAAPVPILTERRVVTGTWVATAGAIVIVLMSWTREWIRFGEQPDAFWYIALILVVLALVALPFWWVRNGLFDDIHGAASSSPTIARIDQFLFQDEGTGSRWIIIVTLAGLTAFASSVILGQLDNLLTGMHTSGGTPVGINSLTSLFELDLTRKPQQIVERVGEWSEYGQQVGPRFATGYAVATTSLAIETFVMVPAYATVIILLLLHARRTPPEGLDASASRSYALVNGIGFLVTAVLVAADLLENLMTWVVIGSAWFTPETLSSWTVRLMWFASLFRFTAIAILVAVAVLLIAFRAGRYRWVGSALVAVRGQILVVLFVAFAVRLGQVEDVIRRWTVSATFLTVAMVTALAVVVQWTSANAFDRLVRDRDRNLAGDAVQPSQVNLPWRQRSVPLRTAVVVSIFAVAGLQVLLVGALGLPAGLGFVIPAALIALIWMFGIPLPQASFIRGDRDIDESVRRWAPRALAASLYVVLGIVVVRAATNQLVFARHGDLWLVFCAVPMALGIYRIATRSWARMGGLEMVVLAAVSTFGVALWIVQSDPELSAVALMFIGLLITFGAMPFYYSYEPDSLPSRLLRRWLPGLKVQPLIIFGAVIAVVTGIALIAAPVRFAGQVGTISVVLLGAMLFAGFAAAGVAFAERTKPPKLLAAFRFKRTPVFLLLFLWIAVGGLAATGATNEVTLVDRPPSSATAVTTDDLWNRWASANTAGANAGEAYPMVFIASSGGGIRAAVWTSYVMDCLFIGSPAVDGCDTTLANDSSIAALSGVSGGSLGIAAWAGATADRSLTEDTEDWVKARLGDDYLASAVAWLLLVDTPRSLIGFGPDIRDRAAVMETAWEASWERNGASFLAEGIHHVWNRRVDLPLMIFNGTSVNDPCRFNISVLDAAAHDIGDTCTSLSVYEGQPYDLDASTSLAATQDLSDYLCDDQDIKLSTAVLLSARFPIVSSSGKLGASLHCVDRPSAAFVVDGAYLEGSGAGTLAELWHQLEDHVDAVNERSSHCVVPFLIQIDNGYENPTAAPEGTSPIEALVPLRTIISSHFGRIANAREQAAIEFDRPFRISGQRVELRDHAGVRVESRYARITTRAHPGIQAPLSWTLSNASFDDLRSQLSIEENQVEFDEIRRWLSQPMTCHRQGESS